MKYHFYFFSLILLFLPFLGPVYAQTENDPFFTVEGEVLTPLKLSMEDLSRMEQTEVRANDRDGKEHIFKGVRLSTILDMAGVTMGKELRGENLTKYILIKAVDGYEVIFSLPEVDPEFTDQTVLLAYMVDGNPLKKGVGPFRIIAPNDKKQARWIRELRSINILFSME